MYTGQQSEIHSSLLVIVGLYKCKERIFNFLGLRYVQISSGRLCGNIGRKAAKKKNFTFFTEAFRECYWLGDKSLVHESERRVHIKP